MSVLAFLGGMGGGYLKQKEVNRQNEREDKRDEMYAQRFQWEKDEAERKKQERTDADALETAQREALSYGNVNVEHATEHMGADGKMVSTPQPSAGDAEFTAFMQNAAKPEGDTNYPETKVAQSYAYTGKDGAKQTFTDEKQAKDYAAANPVTDVDRLNAAASRTLGMKGGLKVALDLQAKAREAENAKLEREKRFKELQNENAFEALRLASIGDAQGARKAFAKSGFWDFSEDTTFTPVERDIKGVGKDFKTFDVVGHLKGKDGRLVPFKGNTFDMGLELLPFQEKVKTVAALNAQGDKSAYQADLAAARLQAAQATADRAAAYSTRASGGGSSNSQRAESFDKKDFGDLLKSYRDYYAPKQGDDMGGNSGTFDAAQAAFEPMYLDATNIARLNSGRHLTAQELREAQRIKALADAQPELKEQLIRRNRIAGTDIVHSVVNVGGSPIVIGADQVKNPTGK